MSDMEHVSELVRAHPFYGTLRGITERHTMCKTRGTLIDAFTASAAWQIVHALNEDNAIKYLNLIDRSPRLFADVTWKLAKS